MVDPISILIGSAAGALIYKYFNEADQTEYSEAEMFMMGVCSFLYLVAEADGTVDAKEEKLIRTLFSEVVKCENSAIEDARVSTCLVEARNNQELQQLVISHAKTDEELRHFLLRSAWRVAVRDGTISDEEVELIVHAAQVMNASHDDLILSSLPYCRRTKNAEMLDAARGILGVPENASAQEVKENYRALSAKYHPDRFSSENPVVVEMAAEKFRQINEAYKLLSGGDENFYVLTAQKDQITQATSQGICRCYFCSQKAKLPSSKYIDTARCAKCQALLAFDSETAEFLFEQLVSEN
jgi:DnaJ-domain-containing protein 1